jgi:hypothetical protein
MWFITNDLYGFADWYISEKTAVKATKSIYRLKANRLQQMYKVGRFLNEGILW